MRYVLLATILVASLSALANQMRAEEMAPDCRLKRVAALDMGMDVTGRITVPVTFNGTKKEMMVDTGASESVITARTASELDLKPRVADSGRSMQGFGGRYIDHVVDIAEFGFGRKKGKNFTFFVDNDYMEAAGLLGADFLYFFDLDFDFSHAQLNLVSPTHCPNDVVYWTHQTYGVIPFEIDDHHILVKVQLDGEDVTAILDTGAADTVMSMEKASNAFDLDRAKLAKSRHYPFKTLSFGEVNVIAPAIQLVPDDESRVMGPGVWRLHMIIGMGVLRRLHLYISYKERKIYVTPATQY